MIVDMFIYSEVVKTFSSFIKDSYTTGEYGERTQAPDQVGHVTHCDITVMSL